MYIDRLLKCITQVIAVLCLDTLTPAVTSAAGDAVSRQAVVTARSKTCLADGGQVQVLGVFAQMATVEDAGLNRIISAQLRATLSVSALLSSKPRVGYGAVVSRGRSLTFTCKIDKHMACTGRNAFLLHVNIEHEQMTHASCAGAGGADL